MAKKKSLLKRTILGGSVGALTAYIGSELNKATKRYEIKEKTIVSDHFRFNKKEVNQSIDSISQHYYEFDVVRRENDEFIGTVQLLMGQEKDSFYGGHIRTQINNLSEPEQSEIILKMAEVARDHLMTHVNFICEKGDLKKRDYYKSLGAVFHKEIKITDDSPYYVKKHNIIEQYRLDCLDANVKEYMLKKEAEKKKAEAKES